ncbi:MAG: hypothetical protein AAB538_05680 [Patescibacteria group bacterium]
MASRGEVNAAVIAWAAADNLFYHERMGVALKAAEKVRRKAFMSGKVGRAYHIEVKVSLKVRKKK